LERAVKIPYEGKEVFVRVVELVYKLAFELAALTSP